MIPTPAQPLFVCESVDSTQLHAQRLLDAHSWAGDGVLFHVAADYQYAGEGRFSRTWDAPTGTSSLVSSIIRIPAHVMNVAPWFTAVCALSICDIVTDLCPDLRDDLRITWPNDVLLGGKKLAGVLAQILPQPSPDANDSTAHLVMGAGINVSIPATHLPTPRATSLLAFGGTSHPSVSDVREGYAARLEERVASLFASGFDTAAIRTEFSARLTGCGELVSATHFCPTGQQTVSGLFTGVDENGSAIITTDQGLRVFSSADISFTCPSTISDHVLEA